MAKQTTIRLGDIVIETSLAVREINGQLITRYAEAKKGGAEFPPVLLEQGTNRLVAGFHRVRAYQMVLEPDAQIPAEHREFADAAALLLAAGESNSNHGLQMTRFEQKNLTARLLDLKVKRERIAQALNVSAERITRWDDDKVIVMKSGKRERKPLKHGLAHMRGQTVSAETYADIRDHYSGWNVSFHAKQIMKHINNATIDADDSEQNTLLADLRAAIDGYLLGKQAS